MEQVFNVLQIFNVSFEKIGIKLKLNSICFYLGNFAIKYYGIIIAFAFLLSFLYIFKQSKDYNFNKNLILDSVCLIALSGIIGARLYYVLFFSGDTYKKNPVSIFYIRDGGLAVYGGVILSAATLLVFCKIKKINFLRFFDLISIGLLLGQAIGRWGNFFNQEAFGYPTDLPWGMKSEETQNIAVHPCFLYESLWCFLGFILMHLFRKKLKKTPGKTVSFYLVWYGFGRFFIEGLRSDSLLVPGIDFLKISQLISILFIALGFIGIFLTVKDL